MAERTMEELLRAPTEGYGEAIVLPEINADHFEIKTNLLQLVQANPFYGRASENPHAHINSFKRITSTLRFRNVPNDVISVMIWEDLVPTYCESNFPPSKPLTLKNEISRFTQKFEETFSEAWERFKELLRACPHHGFTELTQVDTFYNGLNENEQDSLKAAAGGNLLIEIVSYESCHSLTPPVKAVEESCVTCGGAHSWYNCPATDNNQASVCATTGTYNQVNPPNRVSNQMAPPGFAPVQNNGQNRLADLRREHKAICSFYWKRDFFTDLTPTRMTLELADRSITYPKGLAEDVFVKVGKFHFPTDFVVVDFKADPRVPLILGRSFLRTGRALIDVYGEEITLRVDNEAVTFNLDQTTRYSSTNDKSVNRIDIIDVVCKEYALELLRFSNSLGGNPTPTSEPFTSEFILEEIEAYLKDDSISPEIDHPDCDPEGDICLIEKLLNNDPFQLPPMDLKQSEVTEAKSSIEEPPELELKDNNRLT
ncbi:reverse transcriptase domain-containing protein [Tanacetum coccineum]